MVLLGGQFDEANKKVEKQKKDHDSTVDRTRLLTVLMSHSTIKLWNPILTNSKRMLLVRIELTTACLLNMRSTTELKKLIAFMFVEYKNIVLSP